MVLDNIIPEWVIKEYEAGFNPMPFNTVEDQAVLPEYIPYRETPPTMEQIEKWMPLFIKYGVAQMTGLCHRGKFRGLYLNCVDFDDPNVLNKLLETYSLEQLVNAGMFIEQHHDNKGKAHIWILSKKPFPRFKSLGLEVKSMGMLGNMFPSFHKGGYRYFPVGNSSKMFDDSVEPLTNDGFINVIDNLVGGKYLNGNADKNYNSVEINKEPIHKGERHNRVLSYANSLIARNHKTTNRETIYQYLVVFNNDRKEVEEPLPEPELKQMFNDAWDKRVVESTSQEQKSKNNNDDNTEDNEKKRQSKIRVAFETVRQHTQNLFIDEYRTPHIAIPIKDHLEVLPVNASRFKDWYRMFIFERDRIVLDSTTINDLCSLASAYAASPKYGTQIPLNLRTALIRGYKTKWVYDLVNDNWEFIKITSNGWDILKNEIIFRRYNGQQAQVYPDRNYEADILDQFMALVNIKDKNSILLLKCYIISLFIPEIQKVVLILRGSQGAAKSFLEELIKMLVDPSIIKTLSFPRNKLDLILQLAQNYIAYYDNISSLPKSISDELCKAVTGSGFSVRELYTDDGVILRNFKRSVGMNGINLAATQADLLDRSIIMGLDDIEDEDRRLPEELWGEFNNIKAKLLGYILDILVKVLEYEENNPEAVKQLKLVRMTEFAKYGEIISRCMGNKDNEFINAYMKNREIQVDEIVESSQVATTIMCMMFRKYDDDVWDGTATALYTELVNIADNDKWELNVDTNDRYWPKNVKSLGRRLNEVKPALKAKGLKITQYREKDIHRTRKVEIRKVLSNLSNLSNDDKSRSNLDENLDKTMDKTETFLSRDNTQNRAQNQVLDVSDVSDKTLHTITGDVSNFIKLEGIQQGDKISYDIAPTIGDLSVQNNFIGGHLRMRGEGGGRYPTNYLEFIDRVFGPESNTIEVCSNKIAGVNGNGHCFTVDINPEHKPDLVADGQTLEGIRENSFSRWQCDPPYNDKTANEMYGTDLPSSSKLLKAGARVVKPNSLLFLLHAYPTSSNIPRLQKIGYITISAIPNNEIRILNIYVKLPEESK